MSNTFGLISVCLVFLGWHEASHAWENAPGQIAFQDFLPSGGGGAGESSAPPLGFFINSALSVGKAENTENEAGHTFTTTEITVGADYRVDDHKVIGATIGYSKNDGIFINDGGTSCMDGRHLSMFATWSSDSGSYLDGVIEYSRNKSRLSRRINLGINPVSDSSLVATDREQFASGSTEAGTYAITLGGGFQFQRGSTQFGPYGRLSISSTSVDGYSETASNVTAPGKGYLLDINGHTSKSLSIALGGRLSKSLGMKWGVIVPQVNFEMQIEDEDRTDSITASFQQDPLASQFSLDGDEEGSVVVNYGFGVTGLSRNGRSGFLLVERHEGNNGFSRYRLNTGARVEF